MPSRATAPLPRRLKLAIAAGLLGIAWLWPTTGLASDAGIRLGFVYNFAKFTEWPEGSFAGADAPLTICLVRGDDEMTELLDGLNGRRAQGRAVQTRLLSQIRQMEGCHIVYIPFHQAQRDSGYAQAAARNRALAISDRADFLDEGGMIALSLDNSRYLFDISLSAVRRSGLNLNPHLLKLARQVR